MTLNEEKILKEKIKDIIRETVIDLYDDLDEKKKESNETDDSGEDYKKSKKITKKEQNRLISHLKSKGVNKAQFAYKLWPNKKKASARSYFYKCLNKKKNDEGDTYSFDGKDTIKLRSLSNKQEL